MSETQQNNRPVRRKGEAAGIASLFFAIAGLFFPLWMCLPFAFVFGIVSVVQGQLGLGLSGLVFALADIMIMAAHKV